MMFMKSLKVRVSVFCVFVFITFSQNTFAYADTNTIPEQEYTNLNEATNPRLLDANNESENEVNVDDVRKILPNQLGLDRINEYRTKKNLDKLNIPTSEFGNEIIKKVNTTYEEIPIDDLPTYVDNSRLKAFPPIGDQGYLNSCASYATTYYQLTHMFGLKLGWDVKNDVENKLKFSPQWTFNLSNAGENGVFGIETAFSIFLKSGAALWDEFPYNGEDYSVENYTQWPRDASIWRNALNYRIKDYGYISICDGSNTPVKSPNSPSLNKVKQLLNNGYVLTFDTNLSTWRFTTIGDDTTISEDNEYINQYIAHITDRQITGMDGHVMTLVGYNDNIWVDINGNGIVDIGEKGAFKIANSWGNDEGRFTVCDKFDFYSNAGFIWLSYDALNKVSSVPDCPVTERRNAINSRNKLHWICPKEPSEPKLMIEYTVNHSNKYEIAAVFGYSDYNQNKPVSFYQFDILNCPTHVRSSYDGTGNACDATFVFDISDLYDRFDSAKGNLYVTFIDQMQGEPCTLKDLKVIDNVSGQNYYYEGKLPVSFDNTEFTIGPISFEKKLTGLKGIKLASESMCTQRSLPSVVSVGDKIYVIGGIEREKYLKTFEIYDPKTCTWEKKNDLTGEQANYIKTVSVDDKIYAIKRLSSGESVIEEYDADSDSWVYKTDINYWETMSVGQTNGKIYIIGTKDTILKEETIFSMEEYDPVSNTVTHQVYMEKGTSPGAIGFMDGKIYMFNVGRYNTNHATKIFNNPYESLRKYIIYDTVTRKFSLGEDFDFRNISDIITVGNKFYIFWRDLLNKYTRISEYDPETNISRDIDGISTDISSFGIGTYKDSIIAFGGYMDSISIATSEQSELTKGLIQIINIDQDKIPPILEPPADLTIAATEELTVVDIGEADSLGNSEVKVTNNAPKAFPLGTTEVIWRAEDEKGNKTHAIQKVTLIIDKEPPELLVPKDIFIGTNIDNIAVDIGEATASDLFDVHISNDAPQGYPLGKTIVKWVAVDANGNEISKTQQVNVYKFGDIDGNAEVNSLDFAQLRLFLLGHKSTSFSEYGNYAADVDGNKDVNSIDYAIIRKYLLGFIDEFSGGGQ